MAMAPASETHGFDAEPMKIQVCQRAAPTKKAMVRPIRSWQRLDSVETENSVEAVVVHKPTKMSGANWEPMKIEPSPAALSYFASLSGVHTPNAAAAKDSLQQGLASWGLPGSPQSSTTCSSTESLHAGDSGLSTQAARTKVALNLAHAQSVPISGPRPVGQQVRNPAMFTSIPADLQAAEQNGGGGLVMRGKSVGSFGHPELCKRPCLFFAQGQCSSGENCLYCHERHAHRAAHLDKRNRELIKGMSNDAVVAFLGSIVVAKLRSVGMTGTQLEEVVKNEAKTDVVLSRKLKKLKETLEMLQLRTLMKILRDRAPEGSQLPQAVRHLLAFVGSDTVDELPLLA